jgi:hypothetical protein
MVNLHAVATAPRVPTDCPCYARVGRINAGAARGTKILPPMELSGRASEGIYSRTVRRREIENFQWRKQPTCRGTTKTTRCDPHPPRTVSTDRFHVHAFEIKEPGRISHHGIWYAFLGHAPF